MTFTLTSIEFLLLLLLLGKGLLRRPSGFSNGTLVNSSHIMVYGNELRPNCPSDVSNVLVGDSHYCNVFYHCQSGRGSVYMCREGTVFDSSNQDGVSSCRSEELVDCENRLILTSQGKRASVYTKKDKSTFHANTFGFDHNQSQEKKVAPTNKNLQQKYSNFILLPPPTLNQKEIVNVPFDCKGRYDGHWRDARYCDVFHACLAGEQKRSYACFQVAERFYFDDAAQMSVTENLWKKKSMFFRCLDVNLLRKIQLVVHQDNITHRSKLHHEYLDHN